MSLEVADPNTGSSPGYRSLLTVFVGKYETLLGSKEGLPLWEEFDIKVVEHDVLGVVVPVVEVEHSAEIHVRAKRSCPLSLPET